MGYAFISYSTQNGEKAAALRALFRKNGIGVWMAPYDIPAGNKYAAVITSALKNCACIVLLLTDAAQSSEWVDKEIERGINYKKTVIAVQLEDVALNDSFEFYLSNRQIIRTGVIDGNTPEMQSLLHSVIAYTGVTPPDEPETGETPEEPVAKKDFAVPPEKTQPEPGTRTLPEWVRDAEERFRATAKVSGRKLLRYRGNEEQVAVAAGIAFLDSWAFSGQKKIRELYLPDSVTDIGEYAFNSCTHLETVRLPSGLCSLGQDAFNACKSLRSVYLPDGLEEVNNDTFMSCKSLAEVHLPAGLRRIGKGAFSWCKALSEIALPEGLAEIEKDAFCGTTLCEITIPDSVKIIEKGAFSYSNISCIVYKGTKAQWLEANGGNARRGLPRTCIVRCADGAL